MKLRKYKISCSTHRRMASPLQSIRLCSFLMQVIFFFSSPSSSLYSLATIFNRNKIKSNGFLHETITHMYHISNWYNSTCGWFRMILISLIRTIHVSSCYLCAFVCIFTSVAVSLVYISWVHWKICEMTLRTFTDFSNLIYLMCKIFDI